MEQGLVTYMSAPFNDFLDNILAQPTAEAQMKAFQEFQIWANDYNPRIPTHAGSVMHCFRSEVEGVTVCPSTGAQIWSTIRIPEK